MTLIARLLGLPLLVCAFGCTAAGADVPTNAPVSGEIERIEKAWKDIQLPAGSPLAGLVSSSQSALAAAREALKAGRTYVALERLGQAWELLRGAEQARGAAATMAEFEAEWSKAEGAVAALNVQTRTVNWSGAPAALRALSETAMGRTVPLLDGGRGFATATAPRDGLFYTGQALGQAEFAKFCASLPVRRVGRPWRARSLLPELAELQTKVNAAFVPPRSVEQHPRFISLNSTLKLARELDAAKLYHGALYQYLEAVRQFAALNAGAAEAKGAEASQQKLSGSATDDSIAAMFLDGGNAGDVLAAYSAVLKGTPAAQARAGKTIDLTLVRWPYT